MKTLSRILAIALIITLLPTLAIASLQFDADYVGLINDGIPANPAEEVGYINTLTTLAAGAGPIQIPAGTGETYDRIGSTLAGPFATAVTAITETKFNNTNTISLSDTFNYILAKYDGGMAGSLVWYFPSGITGSVTVPQKLNNKDVSHVSAYSAIPEAATIFVWAGLSGLAFTAVKLRRRVNSAV